ncbi:MAG: aldehyde dehydrogenase family protein [Ostreibacterium sp.]
MSKIFQNYIKGKWVLGDKTIININPSDTTDIIGEYTQATIEQVKIAIDSAHSGQKIWAKIGLEARYAVLMAIGDELIARKDELGELLAREEGKTRGEGIGEVYRSGQFFHYFAAEVLRQIGDTADSVRPGIDITVHREPVGVVGVISPWNFPMATAVWKIAPALAFGNAVIFKPANLVPASAWHLTEIISRQQLPEGVFNLLMGSGATVGDALINSQDINAITFTGSLETGRKVATATAMNLTKVQLEMGSKNALLILDDADLDEAVECAVSGAFFGTGQKCTASSRLIITDSVHDTFIEKMQVRMATIQVGHALANNVHMGPVVDENQLNSNKAYLKMAIEEGAKLVCGGEFPQLETEGYFMTPALFKNTTNNMQINRKELFAPIACIIKVANYEEGLATLNDTEFGLTAGIMTQSLSKAMDFKHRAQAGCVMVNLPTAGTDYHVPFGGTKNSSFGLREQGQYAIEFYTTVKTTYLKP